MRTFRAISFLTWYEGSALVPCPVLFLETRRRMKPVRATIVLIISIMFFAAVAWGEEKKGAGKKNVASVDGVAITEDQARIEAAGDLESLELQRLQTQAELLRTEHEILEKTTTRLVEEKLLDLEAAKRGIAKEQLIAQEIRQKVADPTDEEIDILYEMNRDRINRPKEAMMDQLRQFLRDRSEKRIREEFLEQLEKEHKVVREIEPFRFDVKADGHPSLGPQSALVTLILFSDFQCPYCRGFGHTLREIVNYYGDKVRLVFRQFPLKSHANAERAAEASLCANDQKRFWEMHDRLFENQEELTEENILTQARQLELDMEKFKACLTGSKHKADVRADVRAGATAGIDSTPTLFINGLYMSGGQPYDVIAAVIDHELAKKK